MSYWLGGLSKGIKDADNITCNVFGQPFDFSCPAGFGNNSGYMTMVDPCGLPCSMDISSLTPSHEVIVDSLNIVLDPYEDSGVFYVEAKWYRDDSGSWTNIFSYGPYGYRFINAGSGTITSWVTYSYIGYCSWEISKNGNYKLDITFTGSKTGTLTLYFTITGVAPLDPGIPGYLWIKGGTPGVPGHIKFVGQDSYVHQVTVYGSGSYSLTPGYLWIDGTELIYTDEGGNYTGTYADVAGKPNGTPGYIWTEGAYLYYINANGVAMKNRNDY